ncbi:hypothetical protein KC721_02385, partial [Candidatus Woesebacteria bacterium]|nr:hypothetical protein [Candidatus Woesebacteria bacterium]
MKNRFILLPRDFSSTPDRDLGVFGTEQKKLLLKDIDIPKVAIIPLKTLKSIADANRIPDHISSVLSQTNFSDPVACTKLKKTITQTIEQAKIPREIIQELGEIYHRYFTGGKVAIFASSSLPNATHLQVKGDANVFQSLLHHWAASTIDTVFKTRTKHIHASLLSLSFVIQEVLTPTAHGVLYTQNPKTGIKTSVVILSNPGDHDRHNSPDCEEYEVDVRTWNIIKRPHGLRTAAHSLSDSRVVELAKIASTIKRQHLEHKLIHWDLVRNTIVISYMENFYYSHESHHTHSSMTNLYVSAGNPQNAGEYSELPIAGVGYLKSEYSILRFGSHPLSLLHGGKQKILQQSIEKTLAAFAAIPCITHIIYKAFDVSSAELLNFQHGATYESPEEEAWLGTRGAQKALQQPELLSFEIETLKKAAHSTPKRLSLLLPFVRSADELHRLIRLTEAHEIKKNGIETWMQIATLEPLLNIRQYSTEHLDGISIQLDSISNLILGISPTHPRRNEYHLDSQVLSEILRPFIQNIKKNHHGSIPIHIQMEQYNPE